MDMKKKFKDNFIYYFIICLLPTISYGILGPLEIFYGNTKDFNFTLFDFIIPILVFSFGAMLAVSLLLTILPKKVGHIISIVIVGLGLASYIQNMFLNQKLSKDDGSPMNWEQMTSYTMKNTIVWAIILIFSFLIFFFLKLLYKKIFVGTAVFLSAIQIVAVISLLITGLTTNNSNGKLQLSGNDQFSISSKDNIIVYILDTVGNTQIENALKVYPDLFDGLEDFTYWNNADCGYYCTFPSITHLLTGTEFDFKAESSQKWLDDAWNNDRTKDFYDILHKQNYECRLYSNSVGYVYGSIENLNGKFNNVKPVETTVDSVCIGNLFLKMSAYRYLPYFIKPNFEVLNTDFNGVVKFKNEEDCIDDNAQFYSKLTQNGLKIQSNDKNSIIIEHLFGTHSPHTLNKNAEFVDEADILDTLKGLMVIVNEYLNQMKKLGVYDNSTVIIMSDHGAWGSDPQPIFLMKKSRETHEKMLINEAPISFNDFQATILELIGMKNKDFGTSVFDWNPGDERKRSVYMRITDGSYPEVSGSSFNTYYGYNYYKDKEELLKSISDGPDVIVPATPW